MELVETAENKGIEFTLKVVTSKVNRAIQEAKTILKEILYYRHDFISLLYPYTRFGYDVLINK